jgi:DNA-binding response OmpR family regulator
VEDNLDYAEEMAEFLTELEHEVHITNNASDMWSALSQGNVGVVVLDLGLPDEDGFNVIPRMRQLYPKSACWC